MVHCVCLFVIFKHAFILDLRLLIFHFSMILLRFDCVLKYDRRHTDIVYDVTTYLYMLVISSFNLNGRMVHFFQSYSIPI